MRWPFVTRREGAHLAENADNHRRRLDKLELTVDQLSQALAKLGMLDAASAATKLTESPEIAGDEPLCAECDHTKEAHRHGNVMMIGRCKVNDCPCAAYDRRVYVIDDLPKPPWD